MGLQAMLHVGWGVEGCRWAQLERQQWRWRHRHNHVGSMSSLLLAGKEARQAPPHGCQSIHKQTHHMWMLVGGGAWTPWLAYQGREVPKWLRRPPPAVRTCRHWPADHCHLPLGGMCKGHGPGRAGNALEGVDSSKFQFGCYRGCASTPGGAGQLKMHENLGFYV